MVEIVEFLKNFKKFMCLGVWILVGVFLEGFLGIGKMFLVKVVVGEVGVLFFFIFGLDFVEMFVGVGVSWVWDLFE